MLFLVVGGLNTLVGYSLFAIFILVGVSTAVALGAATVLGVLFNFFSFDRMVFRSGEVRRLPRFILFYCVQFVVNLALLRGLGQLGLGPILAQMLILPILSVASFLAMRRLVFQRQ